MRNCFVWLLIVVSSSLLAAEHGDRPSKADTRDDSSTTKWTSPEISGASTYGLTFVSSREEGNSSVENNLNRIKFRPSLDINTNRGVLKTEISLPLPPSLVGLSSLNLTYNSANRLNRGYGIGWTIDLPLIEIRKSHRFGEKTFVNNVTDEGEYVETKEELGKLREEIDRLLVAEKIGDMASVQLSALRPLVDRNFSLLVRLKKQSEIVGHILFRTDGKRYLFNKNGKSVAFYNTLGNSIKFDWSGGVIGQVRESNGLWKLIFDYLEMQPSPMFLGDDLYHVPFGLKTVVYHSSNRTKKIIFKYENEYLRSANYENGEIPLFQGDYSHFKSTVVEEYSNGLKSSDGLVPVLFDKSTRPEFVKAVNENIVKYYFDLNGDGRDDYLELDMATLKSKINALMESVKYNVTGVSVKTCKATPLKSSSDLNAEINSIPLNLSVFIAYKNGERIFYEKDSSLFLQKNARDLFSILVTESTQATKDCGAVTFYNIGINPNPIYFVDLNSDGFKDLLFCKLANGQKGESNKLFNSILDLYGKARGQGNVFSNSSASNGYAHLFAHNKELIKSKWGQIEKHVEGLEKTNFLLNSSSWSKQISIPKCDQYTQFLDYNRDERVDIITGQTVYLNGEDSFFSLSLGVDELRTIFKVDPNIELNNKYALIPSSDQRSFTLSNGMTSYIHPLTGIVSLVSEGLSVARIPDSPVKLLSKLQSPFGGKIKIDYSFVDGRWHVSSKRYEDGADNSKWKEHRYLYHGSMRDEISGVYVGHFQTKETVTVSDEQITPYLITRTFYKDISPAVTLYNDRGRVNGMQKSVRRSGLANNSKVHDESFDVGLERLSAGRIYVYIQKQLKLSNEEGKTWTTESVDDWIYDTFGEKLLPVKKIRESKSAGALTNISGTDLLYFKKVIKRMDYFPESYMFLERSTNVFDDRGEDVSLNEFVKYNELGLPVSRRKGDRTIMYNHDALGRLIEAKDEKGRQFNFSYRGFETMPTTTSDGINSLSFINELILGKLEKVSNGLGVTREYQYSDDGLLRSIKEREFDKPSYEIFKMEPILKIECQNQFEICLDPKVNFVNQGVYLQHELDSMGDSVSVATKREDGVVWSARRNLSLDGTLLQTFLSTPNRDEYVTLTDYSYDELGRVSSVTHQDLYSDQVAREIYSYQGFCKRVSVEDVEKISCHDGFGHNLRTIIPNEEAEIRYGVSGNIVEVENIGMKWGHDSNGNINSFTSNDHHINEMADYLNKGLKIVRSNGDVTEFDQFERAISFNNRVTRAIYRYDSRNGLLKSERTEGGLGILNKAYTHDVHNRVKSAKSNELDENYEYDNWGRVTRLQSGVANKFTSNVGYRYDAGLTSAVTPFVKRVKYNENSSPSLVEFENGLRVSIERDRYTDAITSLTYTHNNRLLWRMSFTLSRTNLESCSGQHRLDGKKVVGTLIRSTLGPLESQDFCYDQSQQLVSVDEGGDKISDLNLSWSNDKLIEVEAVRNLYNAAGSLSLSCQGESCFIRHDLNTVTYKGLFLRLHEIQGLPVAVQINDQFFPVITDHLGTIRGLLAKDGASLLFERRFDPWGKKVAVYTNKVPASSIIENAVVWSFARLIHNPLLNNSPSGTQLYWSQSRVYFASKREWLSFDPTIKWNPQVIAQNPGNWHPYKYASGDPVNYIDPSGHVAGDVWLYRGSNTPTSNLAENAQSLIGKTSHTGFNYSHASLELLQGRQFTAEGSGGVQIQDFKHALNHHSGQIDIYRPINSDKFRVGEAINYAVNKAFQIGNVYGLNGVCSTVTRDALEAGGIKIDRGAFITSPNDLSNSTQLFKAGTYDNQLRMSYE